MNDVVRKCIEDLLLIGMNDLVITWALEGVATTVGGASTPEEKRELVLRIVETSLRDGLMEIGEVKDGFQPWKIAPLEAVRRVDTIWRKYENPGHTVGEFWLRNTEKGNARAREIVAAKRSSPTFHARGGASSGTDGKNQGQK